LQKNKNLRPYLRALWTSIRQIKGLCNYIVSLLLLLLLDDWTWCRTHAICWLQRCRPLWRSRADHLLIMLNYNVFCWPNLTLRNHNKIILSNNVLNTNKSFSNFYPYCSLAIKHAYLKPCSTKCTITNSNSIYKKFIKFNLSKCYIKIKVPITKAYET
jgi:hypothetical protein